MVENHTFMRKMHNCMREKNIDLMKEIIQEGIDNGEFRRLDAGRVADVLRYIFDLRKVEFFLDSMDKNTDKYEISQLEKDSLYTLDIFLNGIIKKDK